MSEPAPARQGGRLQSPLCHLRLVERALVDVDPARVLVLPCAGRNGSQRRLEREVEALWEALAEMDSNGEVGGMARDQ